jgi:hypothetical protein
MDFSIVIAHRGSGVATGLGLWATVQSIEVELQSSPYKYEYLIYTNGEKPFNPDVRVQLDIIQKWGKLGQHLNSDEPVSPPTARQRLIPYAKGDLLFFFDNHILVTKDYFQRAMMDMESYHCDLLHSTTRFFHSDIECYEYRLKLATNFWGEAAMLPKKWKPYKIAAGGHGGFVVRRDVFNDIGGYWEGFTGYGGEEMYFDLKAAMLGKTNWVDPKLIHYHYAGNRGYPRHYCDDYYRNMLMAANIIGGDVWLYKVYDSFAETAFKAMSDSTLFDLLGEAQERSAEHAQWMRERQHRSLDEQLVWFRENDVAC